MPLAYWVMLQTLPMPLNAVPAHASVHVDTITEQRSRPGKNLFGRLGKGEQKFLFSYLNKGK